MHTSKNIYNQLSAKITQFKKADDLLLGIRVVGWELATKGQKGYLGGDRNTLYLDYGYLTAHIFFKTYLTLHLKWVFHCVSIIF